MPFWESSAWIGLTELYKVVEVQKEGAETAGYLAAIVYYGLLLTGHMEYMTMLSILFLILVMAVYVFTFPAYRAEQVMTVFWNLLCGSHAFLRVPDQDAG